MMGKDLMRYKPVEGLFNISEDFDNMVGNLVNNFRDIAENRNTFPVANIKEDDSKYTVEFEIPGIEKEALGVKVKGNNLLIEGEKREENKKKGESYIMIERSSGKFCRTFRFESELNTKKAGAEFKNGILTVTLPKTEEEKTKEVNIKVT
jgi:HSP20 family protein